MSGEEKASGDGSENLIPLDQRTKEKQREIASLGGKASVESRRKKKTFKEIAKAMLDSEISDELMAKVKADFPDLDVNELNARVAMIHAQYKKALTGDSKAFEVLRDTSGEKPVDKKEITGKDGEPLESVQYYKDVGELKKVSKGLNNILDG